jgi:hypothetical protein
LRDKNQSMQTLRVGDDVRFKLAWFEPVWVNARVVSVENPRESYVRVSFGRLGKTRGLDGLCHAWEKMRVAPPRCLVGDRVDVFVPCGVKHRWIGARVIPRSDAAWDEADGDVRVRISNRIDVNVSMINVAPSGHFTTRPRKSRSAAEHARKCWRELLGEDEEDENASASVPDMHISE